MKISEQTLLISLWSSSGDLKMQLKAPEQANNQKGCVVYISFMFRAWGSKASANTLHIDAARMTK